MDYPISDPTIGLVGGKFTDGNPGAGVPASRDPASWANLVTDELLGVLTAAGITPDDEDNTQLLASLVALGLRAASTVRTGVVQLADSATIQTGTDVAMAPTAASLVGGLLGAGGTGANDYVAIPFRDKTTGGRRNLILQWGSYSPPDTTAHSVPLNTTFPTAGLVGQATSKGVNVTGVCAGVTPTSITLQSSVSSVSLFWIAFGY